MVATSLVLDLAEAIEPRYRAMVLLAGFAGLRSGEKLGLRRVDVDLPHAEVHVERQAQEIAGSGRVVLAPKSEAGRRIVALPAIVVEALDHHLAAFVEPEVEAAVFTGRRRQPDAAGDVLQGLAARCDGNRGPGGTAASRSSTPRSHPDGPHAGDHDEGTHGPNRPRFTPGSLIHQHATRERDRAVASYHNDVVAASSRPNRAPIVEIALGATS